MNFIFWRNVLSVFFFIAFVLDLIFGNGVGSWRHWIAGAAFFVSVDDLTSTFDEYRKRKRISATRLKIAQHVFSVLIIAFFIFNLVTGRNIVWFDWIVGVGFMFAVRNLATTFAGRK